MADYTIIVNESQKKLIIKALEKYSQMALGQTGPEFNAAKQLFASLAKQPAYNTTINIAGDIAQD